MHAPDAARLEDNNGHTYTLDEDGERWYDQPKDWSLDDKDPGEMNVKELSAAAARLLGCKPSWWPYYKDWTCSCDRGEHACDSQCSVIADYASDAKYARRIAIFMEEQGMEIPKATATPADICRAALQGE